jgi:hypothetical protein
MSNILSIAQSVADDLSLDPPASLFGLDIGDSTARRMRRAIERTCQHLRVTHDWQQSKREHVFQTIEGAVQPGAIPADFARFVGNTMFDRSRRIPLEMAERDEDWAFINGYPWGTWQIRWVRRANDIWIGPTYQPGLHIAFDYVSDAVGVAPAVPHDVIDTTEGMTLLPNKRYVVRSGHNVKVAPLGLGDSIELVPEGGLWVNLGATFTPTDGSTIQGVVNPTFRDWVSLIREGAGYAIHEQAGHWLNLATPTKNGMMLEASRRYLVGRGHIVYVPVLAAGEQIELVPATGSWLNNSARFVTRPGLEISPPQVDVMIAKITSDMDMVPAYTLSAPQSEQNPFGRARPVSHFQADTDEPLWDDELVILGTIWALQYRDGQQYNEDFRAFERAIYDRLKGSEGYGKINMNGRGGPCLTRPARPTIMVPDNWSEFK